MVARRLEGRDEAILDPSLPIIDSHHHLFDRPTGRYMLDDYVEDAAAGHNIVASVYVETEAFKRSSGPELERPLGEVEFANGIGAIGDSGVYGQCRVAAGIVAFADLRAGEAIAPVLDQAMQLAPRRLRGIRQLLIDSDSEAPYRYITNPPPRGLLSHSGFRRGFAELARRNLSFDAAVLHPQLPELCRLADDFPDTAIILNHAGLMLGMDADGAARRSIFDQWRRDLAELARRLNVTCKIGGFGMPFWGFGFHERPQPIGYRELADAWAPFIAAAIEAFGPDRCMMESNFPPDARSCGFVPLWNALKHAVRSASAGEKAALFHDTAARIYRLDLPAAQ